MTEKPPGFSPYIPPERRPTVTASAEEGLALRVLVQYLFGIVAISQAGMGGAQAWINDAAAACSEAVLQHDISFVGGDADGPAFKQKTVEWINAILGGIKNFEKDTKNN